MLLLQMLQICCSIAERLLLLILLYMLLLYILLLLLMVHILLLLMLQMLLLLQMFIIAIVPMLPCATAAPNSIALYNVYAVAFYDAAYAASPNATGLLLLVC